MLELLSFLSFLEPEAGGEGFSSPAAWAGVSRGTAIGAIANNASVKSLIANLPMHLSRFDRGAILHPGPVDLNTSRPETFPGKIVAIRRGMWRTACTARGWYMTNMSSR